MVKSSQPTQMQAAKSMECGFCGHDKQVVLDCQVPTRLEAIEKLADAVNAVLPERNLAFAVNLCLEELISNTIVHGLKGAPDHFIHVRISVSHEWLEIILKDDAPRFDPFMQAPKPNLDADISQRSVGGLGVHMVKKLMDHTHASYDGSGNLLVLRKSLQRQPAK